MNWRVRPYSPRDREAVRTICADTGFMGNPIDPVFRDRELFADFFTRYYTDFEPANALVVEDTASGRVGGYLLGCLRYRRFVLVRLWLLASCMIPRALGGLLSGRYDRGSCRFLWRLAVRGARETPRAPARCAHFHINLLPAHRNEGSARCMILRFVEQARLHGTRGVFGQLRTRPGRRRRFWERYGFRELERRRISRFERHQTEPVWVATLFRSFEHE
jgi:GNAT superfamily N-acetyltransferase